MRAKAILTDSHFLIPVLVFCFGLARTYRASLIQAFRVSIGTWGTAVPSPRSRSLSWFGSHGERKGQSQLDGLDGSNQSSR